MFIEEVIQGTFINLRCVNENDAEFILKLRLDEEKNKFVNKVEDDIKKEREWIKWQREQEGDYFFNIIRKSDETLLGNVSIYNIDEKAKMAELGRWMSYGASIENVESILLAHDFAFEKLGMDCIYTKTLQDNKKVVSFWKHFGGTAESNKLIDGRKFYYNKITKDDYMLSIRKKIKRLCKNR